MAEHTIKIADKETVDAILTALVSSDSGLAALKKLIAATATQTSVNTIQSLLQNTSYGLNALKSAISAGGGGTETYSSVKVVQAYKKTTYTNITQPNGQYYQYTENIRHVDVSITGKGKVVWIDGAGNMQYTIDGTTFTPTGDSSNDSCRNLYPFSKSLVIHDSRFSDTTTTKGNSSKPTDKQIETLTALVYLA